MKKTIVNSWNEWDPLKHVIVGRADNCCTAPEPAVDVKNSTRFCYEVKTWQKNSKIRIDKSNELLDKFVKTLESRGIRVDRPTPLKFDEKFTPDWKAEHMFGCMPSRDVLITVGKEMLEATMSFRCRWFEYLAYRPLIQKYFMEDPGMKHESAPKPRLTDKDYHKNYLSDEVSIEQRLEWAEKIFCNN